MASGSDPYLAVEDFLELGVATRDGVADHDEIDVARDVAGSIAAQHRNAFALEEVAHRRVDVLIGAAYVAAFALEHRGKRRHRGAADTDEMDALHHH
jgi:tryptophan synthase alpha subunit